MWRGPRRGAPAPPRLRLHPPDEGALLDGRSSVTHCFGPSSVRQDTRISEHQLTSHKRINKQRGQAMARPAAGNCQAESVLSEASAHSVASTIAKNRCFMTRPARSQRRALCVGETCWVGWSARGTGATSFQTQQHNGGRSGGLGQRRQTDPSIICLIHELANSGLMTNHPLPGYTFAGLDRASN